ncbi:EfeM/EfeO family lipoprotein [Conexibacter woesei]|uniref:EfeM/EfeO family lipoprotein n=1 Tax=Conexibacter woesei TaxID=191495 RepID=UPI000418F42C|nr:EfeM/EfeO family lipoprotein [Conexibacter woesei]
MTGLAVVSAVVVFLVLTAAGVGGDSGDRASANTPPRRPATKHLTAAQRYEQQVAIQENGTGVSGAPPPPDHFPIDPAKFQRPIATYKRYAARRLVAVGADVRRLRAALRAGSRSRAQAAWRDAWGGYLRLGGVYGAFGASDTAIDGLPGGLRGGVNSPDFVGLHRLEYGLWTGQRLSGLVSYADRTERAVARLHTRLPRIAMDPADYVLRAHEILEDAQRDYLSGADVRWSHEGVLATAAATQATGVVLGTITPLISNQDAAPNAAAGMRRLRTELAAIYKAHHSTWPTIPGLSHQEHADLDGALGAALEALSRVPGAAETVAPADIPKIPSSSKSSKKTS